MKKRILALLLAAVMCSVSACTSLLDSADVNEFSVTLETAPQRVPEKSAEDIKKKGVDNIDKYQIGGDSAFYILRANCPAQKNILDFQLGGMEETSEGPVVFYAYQAIYHALENDGLGGAAESGIYTPVRTMIGAPTAGDAHSTERDIQEEIPAETEKNADPADTENYATPSFISPELLQSEKMMNTVFMAYNVKTHQYKVLYHSAQPYDRATMKTPWGEDDEKKTKVDTAVKKADEFDTFFLHRFLTASGEYAYSFYYHGLFHEFDTKGQCYYRTDLTDILNLQNSTLLGYNAGAVFTIGNVIPDGYNFIYITMLLDTNPDADSDTEDENSVRQYLIRVLQQDVSESPELYSLIAQNKYDEYLTKTGKSYFVSENKNFQTLKTLFMSKDGNEYTPLPEGIQSDNLNKTRSLLQNMQMENGKWVLSEDDINLLKNTLQLPISGDEIRQHGQFDTSYGQFRFFDPKLPYYLAVYEEKTWRFPWLQRFRYLKTGKFIPEIYPADPYNCSVHAYENINNRFVEGFAAYTGQQTESYDGRLFLFQESDSNNWPVRVFEKEAVTRSYYITYPAEYKEGMRAYIKDILKLQIEEGQTAGTDTEEETQQESNEAADTEASVETQQESNETSGTDTSGENEQADEMVTDKVTETAVFDKDCTLHFKAPAGLMRVAAVEQTDASIEISPGAGVIGYDNSKVQQEDGQTVKTCSVKWQYKQDVFWADGIPGNTSGCYLKTEPDEDNNPVLMIYTDDSVNILRDFAEKTNSSWKPKNYGITFTSLSNASVNFGIEVGKSDADNIGALDEIWVEGESTAEDPALKNTISTSETADSYNACSSLIHKENSKDWLYLAGVLNGLVKINLQNKEACQLSAYPYYGIWTDSADNKKLWAIGFQNADYMYSRQDIFAARVYKLPVYDADAAASAVISYLKKNPSALQAGKPDAAAGAAGRKTTDALWQRILEKTGMEQADQGKTDIYKEFLLEGKQNQEDAIRNYGLLTGLQITGALRKKLLSIRYSTQLEELTTELLYTKAAESGETAQETAGESLPEKEHTYTARETYDVNAAEAAQPTVSVYDGLTPEQRKKAEESEAQVRQSEQMERDFAAEGQVKKVRNYLISQYNLSHRTASQETAVQGSASQEKAEEMTESLWIQKMNDIAYHLQLPASIREFYQRKAVETFAEMAGLSITPALEAAVLSSSTPETAAGIEERMVMENAVLPEKAEDREKKKKEVLADLQAAYGKNWQQGLETILEYIGKAGG